MYNHGAHVHFAQFRDSDGQELLFETLDDGTFRGTGPCLRRDNMLVFRSLVIHYWLQLTELLQKKASEWAVADKELAAETLEVFPALQHLPEVNSQNVVQIVDLAIFGSERGELKPMNGSMRSVFTPKVKNCPQCELYREMEDGSGTCILCGGCGRVQDDAKVYSTDWGCILDFDEPDDRHRRPPEGTDVHVHLQLSPVDLHDSARTTDGAVGDARLYRSQRVRGQASRPPPGSTSTIRRPTMPWSE